MNVRCRPASLALAVLLVFAAGAGAGADERSSRSGGPIDWSKVEGIDPHRPDVLDFLDADLAAHVRRGEEAHAQGRYEEAARLYLYALRHRTNSPRLLYNLACAFGRLGEGRLAVRALEAAVETGFVDFETLRSDKDFEPLRNNPRFVAARDRLLSRESQIGRPIYVQARQMVRARLHLPADFDSARSYPLVIGLHGNGGNCEEFARIWTMLDNPQIVFVAPESPYAYPPAPETPRIAYTWGLPTRDEALWESADPLVADNMRSVVEEIGKTHRISGAYLLGHSQGAAFAYLAAIKHPDLFKGVIALAGVFPEEQITAEQNAGASKKVRIFIGHGRQDPAIAFATGVRTRDLLTGLGYEVTFAEFQGGHNIDAGVLRRAIAWTTKGTGP